MPSVLAALAANLAIAAAKGVAAALTGSSALLAETLHSVADAGNEAFLLIALRRSSRPADAAHPFGYGAERFYWALLAALGMFVVGAGVAVWQGVNALLHPPEIEAFWVGVAVLVISIALDGSSRVVAGREVRSRAARRSISLRQYLGETSDPTVTTVFLEDTADVVGAALALAALVLHQVTGAALPDALASLAIGALLGYVALRLASRNRELLTNRAIPERYLEELSRLIAAEPGVEAVVGLQGIYLGPATVLITGDVRLESGLDGRAAGEAMARLREQVRTRYSDVVAEVYLTPVGGPRPDGPRHGPGLTASAAAASAPARSSPQSARTGAKTSTTTAPSAPARASWGRSRGRRQVPPGPSARVSSPTRHSSVPASTRPSCSLGWWCSGTTAPGSNSTTARLTASPVTARATTPSQMGRGASSSSCFRYPTLASSIVPFMMHGA